MESLKKKAEEIKSLKIQGATDVALSAIQFLSDYAREFTCSSVVDCINKLQIGKEILEDTRPTEPAMQNGLNFIMNKIRKCQGELCVEDVPGRIEKYKDQYEQLINDSKKRIAEIGARRIPMIKKDANKEKENSLHQDDDFVVMTHCHSSVVNAILLKAKEQGKNFRVVNTETQPKLQGRKTSRKLSKAGIEVIHIVDSAMRWAVKKYQVDLIIIGADSITSEGTVLNKIGSRLLALVAHEEHVPFYVASPLLKYQPITTLGFLEKIEMRNPSEVWKEAPKNVKIKNPAFETVSRRYIDGLITEAGIFASSHAHMYYQKFYPDLAE
ncbi:MAG: S-methyl-5-thioribose-1-phosphate isomerase [Promethearchaeota archaeon]|nr:MAG: S-methyl-5-thioribose-1-phosphate isomerase [Candidatus Lokiarchaeota archaeon]